MERLYVLFYAVNQRGRVVCVMLYNSLHGSLTWYLRGKRIQHKRMRSRAVYCWQQSNITRGLGHTSRFRY